MTDSIKLLSSIVKTTQMGQIGIRCVMRSAVRPGLKNALKSQLREYSSIEREARSIAASRGWELESLEPAAKVMANVMTRAQLSFRGIDSRIAAMMIQGNTRGMIKSIQNMHHLKQSDVPVAILSQKLLDCETANIQQMQGFL